MNKLFTHSEFLAERKNIRTNRTNRIASFSEFLAEKENRKYTDLLLEPSRFGYDDSPIRTIFSLKENIMPKFSKGELLSLFGINESNIDEQQAIITNGIYELGLLGRNRKDWFLTEGTINTFPSKETGKVLLHKNGEIFVISKETFDNMDLIRENIVDGFLGIGKSFVSSVSNWVEKAVSDVGDALMSVYNDLSSAAKGVCNFFSGFIGGAAGIAKQFLEDPGSALGSCCTLLAGVCNYIPAMSTITPYLIGIGGMGFVYSGYTTLKKSLSGNGLNESVGEKLEYFTKNGPALLTGLVPFTLGLNDMYRAINSKKGELGVNGDIYDQATSIAKEISPKFVETFKGNYDKIYKSVSTKGKLSPIIKAKKDVNIFGVTVSPQTLVGLLTTFATFGNGVLSSIMDTVIKIFGQINKLVQWVMNIPTMLKNVISGFLSSKGALGILATVIIESVWPTINKVIVGFLNTQLKKEIVPSLNTFNTVVKDYSLAVTVVKADFPESDLQIKYNSVEVVDDENNIDEIKSDDDVRDIKKVLRGVAAKKGLEINQGEDSDKKQPTKKDSDKKQPTKKDSDKKQPTKKVKKNK